MRELDRETSSFAEQSAEQYGNVLVTVSDDEDEDTISNWPVYDDTTVEWETSHTGAKILTGRTDEWMLCIEPTFFVDTIEDAQGSLKTLTFTRDVPSDRE